MSDSKSDNKEVVETEAVVTEVKAEEVKETKKPAKAKAAKKATKAKKVEEVAASETAEVVVEKEEVNETPYITGSQKEDAPKTSVSTSVYLSIAAGVVLAVALTIVVFFQDDYESVVASLKSADEVSEIAANSSVATQDEGVALVNNVAMPTQPVQTGFGYQSAQMNQDRNQYFSQLREKNQAAYIEAKRQHDEKMAKLNESRAAAFKRMNQQRVERQNKFRLINEKVQKIQLEMQQKMKAAYDEFNSI